LHSACMCRRRIVAGPIARRPKAPSLSCQLARRVSCMLKLSWSLRSAKDALAAHPPKLQSWPWSQSRSSSPVLLLLIPQFHFHSRSGLLIWKGNQVRAALPLSNPGPCCTGQAKVLVRALQCDPMACVRGYGSSRWAGTESWAYHDGGWVIFCSDSGGGMSRRRSAAALGRVWG
jgi:hypothetical protein